MFYQFCIEIWKKNINKNPKILKHPKRNKPQTFERTTSFSITLPTLLPVAAVDYKYLKSSNCFFFRIHPKKHCKFLPRDVSRRTPADFFSNQGRESRDGKSRACKKWGHGLMDKAWNRSTIGSITLPLADEKKIVWQTKKKFLKK